MCKKNAVNFIKQWLGIKTRATTFKGLKKVLTRDEEEFDRRKFQHSNWDMDSLVRQANLCLDQLYNCANVSHAHIKDYSEQYASQKDWADLRIFGPYIASKRENADYQQAEIFGEPPYFATVGIDLKGDHIEELHAPDDGQDWIKYAFITMRRMDALPFGYIPLGPGYPYIVHSVSMAKMKNPVKITWYCTIEKTGQVHLTKKYVTRYQHVHSQHAHKYIPRRSFVIQDPFKEMTHDNEKPIYSQELTTWALDMHNRIDLNVTVRISDHRGVVNVSISMEDAVELFKKRVKIRTRTGRSKPIFHWVSSHQRVTGANVKTHWRGLRKFKWKGLDVEITVPGAHTPLFHDTHTIESSNLNWASKLMNKTKSFVNPYSKERTEDLVMCKGADMESIYYKKEDIQNKAWWAS